MDRPVLLDLPPPPPAWRQPLEGVPVDLLIDVEVILLPGLNRRAFPGRSPGERISVDLPKERVAIVQSTPRYVPRAATTAEFGATQWFSATPAAAVYPYDLFGSEARMTLSYADGPPAQMLLRAAAAGLDLERFNVRRFLDRCREVAGEMSWALDHEAVFEPLSEGRFRETAVRVRELHEVDIEMPPGRWLAEIATLSAAWLERGVPSGVYRFRNADWGAGGGEELHVAVDEDGKTRTLRVSPPQY